MWRNVFRDPVTMVPIECNYWHSCDDRKPDYSSEDVVVAQIDSPYGTVRNFAVYGRDLPTVRTIL